MPEQINNRALAFLPVAEIEPKALQQIVELSQMPFIHGHVAVMPDVHFGRGAPVGSVIPTVDAIIPAAVGVDLGCGMMAVKTSLHEDQIDAIDRKRIREKIEQRVPMGAGKYCTELSSDTDEYISELEEDFLIDYSGCAGCPDVEKSNLISIATPTNWKHQLGTLGGGNHFIEIVADEGGDVWAFLHSGSRGIGNKIAQYYIARARDWMKRWHINLTSPDLAYLVHNCPDFHAYLNDLTWAQNFALLNRDLMMDRVLEILIEYYGDVATSDEIRCHHNFTQLERYNKTDVLVSRKGAIMAGKGVMGLIPGSMGTRSYVVRGLGDLSSYCSAPHGAGRRMSRRAAKQAFTMEDFDRDMDGIEVRRSPELLDELPGAYKSIDSVMSWASSLVEPVHEFHQLINAKGD